MVSWWMRGTPEGEAALPDEDSARERLLPGRKPFIVPPLATKSVFYDNPVTVQLWRYAKRVLAFQPTRQPLRVSLLGYSLPLTDLVTSSLLRETLVEIGRGMPVQIDVANIDCDTVCEHLRQLGIKQPITPFDSLAAFAGAYQQQAAEELAAGLHQWIAEGDDTSYPVAVGRSLEQSYAVEGVRRVASDECELPLIPYPPGRPFSPVGQTGPHWSNAERAALTVRELMVAVVGMRRINAMTPTGRRTLIIGAAYTTNAPTVGIPGWQILLPAEEIAPT
jgi:hypothetical protein